MLTNLLIKVKTIFVDRMCIFKQVIFILIEYFQINSLPIFMEVGNTILEGVKVYQEDMKEETFSYLFDVLELL